LVGYALVKTLRITLTALVAGTVAGWTLAIFGAVLGRGVSFLGELIHVFASSLPPALVALMFASFAARTGQADLWLTGALTLLEVHRSYRAATRTAARVKVAPHTVAAQALGASQWFLIRHYYLPEVWQLWKPAFALELADLAAIEATVSFLGLGSTTADPTLGRLVADGRYFLATAPWLVSAPALVIVALLAAGVRQLFVARGTQ
jgi:peptide/nickel transport system permease protein